MYATPLEKAQTSFNEAASGQFRGRESFCKLLDAMSHLRAAGSNPDREDAYARIKTTKQNFQGLLSTLYCRAARENYEDSTDERFLGSGRPILEALSDLHLVPVYMKLGGLDPQLEESWTKCGVTHADYIAVYNARRIDEAARVWEMIRNRNQPASNVIARENILTILTEAGLDVADESIYARIKTTKQNFERYRDEQKNLRDRPYARPIFA